MSIVTKLLAACKGEEAKYTVQSSEGKPRIGNAERTVLVALAHAAVLAEQERCKCPSFLKRHLFMAMTSREEMEYREASVKARRRDEHCQVSLQVRSVRSNRNLLRSHTGFVSKLPNYDTVIPALLTVGVKKLRDECKLTPGGNDKWKTREGATMGQRGEPQWDEGEGTTKGRRGGEQR